MSNAFPSCVGPSPGFGLTLDNSSINASQQRFDCLHSTAATTIIIPDTVVTIGNSAFLYRYMYSMILPNSLTLIDTWAFQYCEFGVGTISIPDSVRIIGSHAFQSSSLQAIVIQTR
eukprot:m.76059 g.76059  ORF g.76059 m.76059 type:complete len:116 (-) comp10481_c0_seq2:1853-2200(-)